MKKVLKILGRLLLGLLLLVYVVVALVNYSVVQSYAGAVVGNYFSKEWGGKVAIGSLHAMPWDHVILDRVLWVAPSGDTLFNSESLRVAFDRFPFYDNTLDMKRVTLHNTYYHLAINEEGINLKFVIDYFKPEHPSPSKEHPPFTVKVGTLELDNVHYKMDLVSDERRIADGMQVVEIPHMEFFDIHAKIKDVKVVNDDVKCQIVRFSTRERSGFELKELSGQVHVGQQGIIAKEMNIRTGGSTIVTDAELRYDGWQGISGYVSTVRHEVELKEGTRVSIGDVSYWAPVMGAVKGSMFKDWPTVEAVGQMRGTVDSMWTDLTVRVEDSSLAVVKGTVRGLPRIDTTTFNVDIDLTVRGEGAKTTSHLSPLLAQLQWAEVGATVKGGLKRQASVDISLESNLGNLLTQAALAHVEGGYSFAVKGKGEKLMIGQEIEGDNLDLEADGFWNGNEVALSDWQWLDRLEGGVKVESGKWRVKSGEWKIVSDDLRVDGDLRKGQLTATVASKDSLMDFDLMLKGSRKRELTLTGDLEVRRLEAGLLPQSLATRMTFSTQGESLEDLSGTLHSTGTHYGTLKVKELDLTLQSADGDKALELKSDIADATVNGHFRYNELEPMLQYFEKLYLPTWEMRTENPEDLEWDTKSNIQFHVHWKKGNELLQKLAPGLAVAQETRVDGSYNFDEQLRLVARSDSLSYGGVTMEGVGVLGYRDGRSYVVEVESQDIRMGRMELMERAKITVKSRSWGNMLSEDLRMGLIWGNGDQGNRGNLALTLKGERLTVEEGWFFVGDVPWELKTDNLQVKTGFRGLEGGVSAESAQQRIGAGLSLCGLPSDRMELDFERFNLGLLSDIFLQESPVTVDGNINGRFSLYGLGETPYFNANLMIDSCMVNNQALDTVKLTSHWNAELNMLNLNLDSRQVTAGGFMELGKKTQGLHFNVDFSGFELALVAPLLTSFSSRFEGQLHGNFDIGGTLSHPLVLGEAFVDNGALKVDITNVVYRFSDSIQFDNNEVRLRNFDIIDPLGNAATLNGNIVLTNEKELSLDLDLITPNILLLDKRGGDDFYGRLLASANGRVKGTTSHLDIDVNARTNTGCELTVPITQQQRVRSQSYITFVNDHEPVNIAEVSTEDSTFDYTLNLDLAITPDLKLELPMDFDEIGADASVAGEGDLHFTLSNSGSPQLMGNYEITSGTMKVALLSLYEKRFSIKNGSNLNFPGNLPDARFDLQAVYSQRVNLSTLTGNTSNIDNSQKYLQVENIIAIAGTLNDPQISFALNLPNADQSVEEEVFAYIDRNSERDMLTQTVSLLVNGRFSSVNNNNQSEGNALDFVTSFVGNSLSDMVQFVDVNIDYKAATESTNQHLDVNISKDWGRWYLESTLGYGGESRAMSQSAVSGAVIDALIGYRVSPVFHLYAYNRTNTNDYTRIDLPFKQGAGMKLTKDFDRWKDLFKKKK